MLRRLALAALAAVALTSATAARAAPAAGPTPTVGVGISIVPDVLFAMKTVEIFVPITLQQLRIEPSIGIFTDNGGPVEDRSDVTLGVGVFYMIPLAAQADLYAGGRLKLNFASVTPVGAGSTSGTDVYILAALGGEYFLAPQRFSIGLEGQLGFRSLSRASGDSNGIYTNGLGFLRLYF